MDLRRKSNSSIALAAGIYVALAFAAGFAFGVLREMVLRPLTGEIVALSIEAPVMLAVCFVAARWTVRHVLPASGIGECLVMGLAAFALLIGLEIAGSLLLRGLSFEGWLAQLATARGMISLALFAAFAAMPALATKLNVAPRF